MQDIPTPLTTDRSELTFGDTSRNKLDTSSFLSKNSRQFSLKVTQPKSLKNPPWRGNSFNPNHTFRFNYLENEKEDTEKRFTNLINDFFYLTNFNLKFQEKSFDQDSFAR